MSDYIYCPACGVKNNDWSGFWPDRAFQVRRASEKCNNCGFSFELIVQVSDGDLPKVNLNSLRTDDPREVGDDDN